MTPFRSLSLSFILSLPPLLTYFCPPPPTLFSPSQLSLSISPSLPVFLPLSFLSFSLSLSFSLPLCLSPSSLPLSISPSLSVSLSLSLLSLSFCVRLSLVQVRVVSVRSEKEKKRKQTYAPQLVSQFKCPGCCLSDSFNIFMHVMPNSPTATQGLFSPIQFSLSLDRLGRRGNMACALKKEKLCIYFLFLLISIVNVTFVCLPGGEDFPRKFAPRLLCHFLHKLVIPYMKCCNNRTYRNMKDPSGAVAESPPFLPLPPSPPRTVPSAAAAVAPRCSRRLPSPLPVSQHHYHHQFLNREGRWDTTDDFVTSFLHFSLFSTALWDLPNSRPVHSLMLSSHLFLCLPCLLPPFIVPCKMVLARPDERET